MRYQANMGLKEIPDSAPLLFVGTLDKVRDGLLQQGSDPKICIADRDWLLCSVGVGKPQARQWCNHRKSKLTIAECQLWQTMEQETRSNHGIKENIWTTISCGRTSHVKLSPSIPFFSLVLFFLRKVILLYTVDNQFVHLWPGYSVQECFLGVVCSLVHVRMSGFLLPIKGWMQKHILLRITEIVNTNNQVQELDGRNIAPWEKCKSFQMPFLSNGIKFGSQGMQVLWHFRCCKSPHLSFCWMGLFYGVEEFGKGVEKRTLLASKYW